MRSLGIFLLCSALSFAQQRSAAGFAPQRPAGFSAPAPGAIYPGTGRVPVAGANHFHSGTRPLRPRQPGAVVYVPYAVGGYSYYGPQTEYPAQMIYPDQGQQSPTVIINQNFVPQTANPIVREYMPDANGGIQVYSPQPPPAQVGPPPGYAPQGAEQQSGQPEAPSYLIALKDHTIYAAVGYWVQGDTLHYLTAGNTHNQVSLDLVDRELSARLNGERGVDFLLPPGRK